MYPGLVSCPFYAIPIYPFKFIKFFIYLYNQEFITPAGEEYTTCGYDCTNSEMYIRVGVVD